MERGNANGVVGVGSPKSEGSKSEGVGQIISLFIDIFLNNA